MALTFCVANQKGGVGKTTTAVNLSAALSKLKQRVLLIDLDPQGNATTGSGVGKDSITETVYPLLFGQASFDQVVVHAEDAGYDLLPANRELAGAEVELVQLEDRDERLKNILLEQDNNYDFVIIDCPPSLGLITTNALTASNSVIIPVQCEFFALEGIMQLLNTIRLAQKQLNPNLDIEGVLLTMLDSRTNLGFEVVDDIRKFFKEKVYNTIIPRLIRLTEAPSHGEPIIVYDPKSKGSEAYLNLAKEVIDRNGN